MCSREGYDNAWKVLKFGGKSLANGDGITRVQEIIQAQVAAKGRTAVVLSARGKATDQLEALLNDAKNGTFNQERFDAFVTYQFPDKEKAKNSEELEELKNLLYGIAAIRDYSTRTKDQVFVQKN